MVGDHLEILARSGTRWMSTDALNEEVEAYLQPGRYRRPEDEAAFRGYCSGISLRGWLAICSPPAMNGRGGVCRMTWTVA